MSLFAADSALVLFGGRNDKTKTYFADFWRIEPDEEDSSSAIATRLHPRGEDRITARSHHAIAVIQTPQRTTAIIAGGYNGRLSSKDVFLLDLDHHNWWLLHLLEAVRMKYFIGYNGCRKVYELENGTFNVD